METPQESHPLSDQEVHEFVAGDGLHVLAGDGQGCAEEQLSFLQAAHGGCDLVEHPLATPGISFLLPALQADGGHEIAQLLETVRHRIIDPGAVGVGHEVQVVVPGDHI